MRFEGISGRIDQGAGILFNLQPNGDYLTLRANPLENNLVLWKFEKGRRSSVKWIRNTPTPTRTWHDLKVNISGKKVEGYLDGKLYLEHDLPAPVAGRMFTDYEWMTGELFRYKLLATRLNEEPSNCLP